MWRCGSSVAAAILFVCAPAVSMAAQPAKPGAKGNLEIEWAVEGKLSEKSGPDSTDWTIKRQLTATMILTAGNLQQYGFTDPQHQAEAQAGSDALAGQAQAPLDRNAGSMAELQKAVEACGDNEACLTALAMQMANQPGMQAMGADAAAMAKSTNAHMAANPPRYQTWSLEEADGGKTSGKISLNESLKRVIYDPICTKTKFICNYARDREGARTFSGQDDLSGLSVPMIEVDTKSDSYSITIQPPLMMMDVQEVVAFTPEMDRDDAGTRNVQIPFTKTLGQKVWDEFKIVGLPLAGGSSSVKGEKTIQIAELDDYQGPIKLTLRWRFQPQ